MVENNLTAHERLGLIHNKNRPTINDYIKYICDDFIEMCGDRYYGNDASIIGGIAYIEDIPVTIIGNVKGKNLNDNKKSNFAMSHPEGYRKALRLAKQAEKFKRPVIFFIDTPGAYCGVEAEERGQGEAIARNLLELMKLKTPIISVVTGEGGSGGALALGVCDELAMLSNALYSVISPRGFASLLWKDDSRESEAADIMKITAEDLTNFGICDYIIEEPIGGAHNDIIKTAENIKIFLLKSIRKNMEIDIDVLLKSRYTKFRNIGVFTE